MMIGVLFLLLTAGAVVLVLGLLLRQIAESKRHPSNLASESRRSVRPVTEAVERLERLVEQNKGRPEVTVIGPQAVEAARKVREECFRWAMARDELAPLVRREGAGGGRASELVAKIDQKIAEAAETVDGMATRMAEQAVSSYDLPDDNSLDEMLKRLESLGQSMDEVQETLDVRVR